MDLLLICLIKIKSLKNNNFFRPNATEPSFHQILWVTKYFKYVVNIRSTGCLSISHSQNVRFFSNSLCSSCELRKTLDFSLNNISLSCKGSTYRVRILASLTFLLGTVDALYDDFYFSFFKNDLLV